MAKKDGPINFNLNDVQNVVNSMEYFGQLSSRDAGRRKQGLDSINYLVEQYLSGRSRSGKASKTHRTSTGDNSFKIQSLISGILRLSLECPFDDVRERMTALLVDIKNGGHGVQIPKVVIHGPCTFIAKNETVPPDTSDEQTRNVFMDAFVQNHRLDHISQVMGYHPDYLRNFLTTQNFLMREDGPLPYDYRHYIAIIAAARHGCTYLVKLHEQEFLLHNGNAQWLEGINYAPRKIQDLYDINKILAHRPWLITKEHVAKLLRGSEPWSLSQLMHAIILLTHFHSMCSFVYGCGITEEIDLGGCSYGSRDCHSETADGSTSDSSDSISNGHCRAMRDEAGVGLEVLMERMRRLTETSIESMSQEELIKRFQSVKHQSAEIAVPSTKYSSQKPELQRYVIDPDFAYTDFATRDSVSEVATFRACDYSWDDHGFSLANRLYTDIGNLLDDKYNMAANMTYYTMGDNQEVDTSSFRRAIWNYIHCMYGIRHDDYDYAEVNQLLERDLKAYIKTLTCYPERLQKKDYDQVMREFKHSEKVHVNLMLMEARQQAELLYALRALNRYIT